MFTRGDRLRKARERLQLGQGEFADLLGVSRGLVSNYERDEITRPKAIVMRQWAESTGVDLDWLMWGVAQAPPPTTKQPGEPNKALAKLTASRRGRAGGTTGQYFSSAA